MKVIRIVMLVAVLLSGLVVAGCPSGSVSEGVPAPGGSAPDFQLKSLEGETVSLDSLKGRPVMVNFWATWCGSCRVERPFIQEIYEDPAWSEQGLVILAVNLRESSSLVWSFMDYYGLTFMVLLDTRGEVGMMYNVSGIPTTYFIDKDGIIKDVKIGTFRNKAEIEQILSKLVAGE